jgi:hypothetical protein
VGPVVYGQIKLMERALDGYVKIIRQKYLQNVNEFSGFDVLKTDFSKNK